MKPKDLHIIGQDILKGLKHVFHKSLDTLKFPTPWKTAQVACSHKKGPKNDCGNYRPISLLSIPSKILESIVCKTLDDHLQEYELLHKHQWGFRKNHSTEQALLHMTERWRISLDNNQYVGVFFLDFQKAFDSVNHEILAKKLQACGFAGNLYDWVTNYLHDR